MDSFETDSDVMTRHEIFTRLESCRVIVTTEGVGHIVKRDTWQYIDFLLDTMIDLDFIHDVEAVVIDGNSEE